MKWFDNESGEVVTEEQLYSEYLAAVASDPDGDLGYKGLTFNEYIENSLTLYNGTLDPFF